MSDHTIVYTTNDTWSWPVRGVRSNLVYVRGVGGGGGPGKIGGGGGQYHGGGGGEAGEYKAATISLANQGNIGITIGAAGDPVAPGPGGASYFGSYIGFAGGNPGNNGSSGGPGAGGSGNPGNDGTAGSSSSSNRDRIGGTGGRTGVGYGDGADGYNQGGLPATFTPANQGFIEVSWDDAGYCYVVEGE